MAAVIQLITGPPREAPKPVVTAVGRPNDVNPYRAEIQAVATALKVLSGSTRHSNIVINSRNQAALRAISHPKQQSAQQTLHQVYAMVQDLRARGNRLVATLCNSEQGRESLRLTKKEAKSITATPFAGWPLFRSKTTVLRKAVAELQPSKLPDKVGAFSKRVDCALPGKHTVMLYDTLIKPEARVLVQLRTGMIRLSGYLHRIGARDSPACPCGHAVETVNYFLFAIGCCGRHTPNEATSHIIWAARGPRIQTTGHRTCE